MLRRPGPPGDLLHFGDYPCGRFRLLVMRNLRGHAVLLARADEGCRGIDQDEGEAFVPSSSFALRLLGGEDRRRIWKDSMTTVRACKKCGAPCEGRRHYCNRCHEAFYAETGARSALLTGLEQLADELARSGYHTASPVLDAPTECGLLIWPDTWSGPPGEPPQRDVVDRLVRDELDPEQLDIAGRSLLDLFADTLKVVVVDEVGGCDICESLRGCYDAADRSGVWGNMCEDCFLAEGGALGSGVGQYLLIRETIRPAAQARAASALEWWKRYLLHAE